MTKKITFQFDEKLQYQLDAVSSVVQLFEDLPQKVSGIYENATHSHSLFDSDPVRNIEIATGSSLLDNLRKVQLENELYADSEVFAGNNFTVEMETGTGKTYVYLRTILELYKKYGFKKFMIIVPSIAIRLGVEKSIEMLREHFKALSYGIDIGKHSFVYDSKNSQKMRWDFVEKNDLSICVMNIQAFNKDNNIIRQKRESGQILWEDIQGIRPIVIIDEPQKIEGGSQSLEAIEELNPLFILRYSATHKKLYNQVYKLNSYNAYKQNLVKSIQVKTVNGVIPKDFPYIRYVDFKDLKAKIEIFAQEQGRSVKCATFLVRGNASLYDLSGGMPQYRDYRIAEDPHKLKPLKINTPSEQKEIPLGSSTYETTDNGAIRVQIKLAIENHFEKQKQILDEGLSIKALTLFFVDSVSKVRDNTQTDGRGEYLRIFDEEYAKFISENQSKDESKKTFQTLHADTLQNVNLVREGYFAVDSNRNAVEVNSWKSDTPDGKIKYNESMTHGIELILKKKDELISFAEPLAFIFSHSALREGWDNPNVFTICTLKNSGSEIAKKQEIGRGLRLPVDINGVRCMNKAINELTVIANDSFAHFADSLQKDFNEAMGFNENEVTPEILKITLQNAGVPTEKIEQELVDKLREELFNASIIDAKNMLTKDADKIVDTVDFSDPTLKEHAIKIKKEFKAIMIEKGTNRINIKNGDIEHKNNGTHSYVNEDSFYEIYKSLSEKLSKRTIYKLDLDKDEFIKKCTSEINELLTRLSVNRKTYEVTTAEVRVEDSGRFGVGETKKDTEKSNVKNNIRTKSNFEIVNDIMYHTNLPRLAIFRILKGIEDSIMLSEKDTLDRVVRQIKKKLSDSKVSEYEIIDGYKFDDKLIFEADNIDEQIFEAEKKVYETKEANHKAVNKYYRMDSKGEYDFAESLDNDPNVKLFTKIKKGGFVIDTPYGNYTPDWGNLSDIEQTKIHCGELHFKAVDDVSSDKVIFNWANSYEDFEGFVKTAK